MSRRQGRISHRPVAVFTVPLPGRARKLGEVHEKPRCQVSLQPAQSNEAAGSSRRREHRDCRGWRAAERRDGRGVAPRSRGLEGACRKRHRVLRADSPVLHDARAARGPARLAATAVPRRGRPAHRGPSLSALRRQTVPSQTRLRPGIQRLFSGKPALPAGAAGRPRTRFGRVRLSRRGGRMEAAVDEAGPPPRLALRLFRPPAGAAHPLGEVPCRSAGRPLAVRPWGRPAGQEEQVKAMYLPAWPGLGLREVLAPRAAGPLPFPLRSPDSVRGFAARYLIYHLFRALGFGEGGTVLVPDYHHGNEVRAIRAAGASIVWYRIGRDLLPDLDELDALCRQGARALLAIHYFGRPQPIDEIGRMCRERGILLVEDCALALLSEAGGRPLGTFGDYAVFCLYKTLPVPNGGVLVANNAVNPGAGSLRPCSVVSVTGPSVDLLMRWVRSRNEVFGRVLLTAKRAIGRTLSGV